MVRDVEGAEALSHLLLGAARRQHARQVLAAAVRPVPRPDEGRGHIQRDVVRARRPRALDRDGDVRQGKVVVARANLRG